MMNNVDSNKKIAKNTMFLYIRMFVMMLVGLFTSRIVLDVLGVTDFGIYNIIGGVVILFSFINSALLSATQRYLNFYIGKNDEKSTKDIFCMSLNTYIILSAFFLFMAETIGLWFVNTKLNIPMNRMVAANWVYQFTIITTIIGLIKIPYNATIIAYERMNFYAYVSLAETIIKLLVVYVLYVISFDKLITYSFMYLIVPITIFFVYKSYCNKKFPTSIYTYFWNKKIFSELFSFSGWSLFGSVSNLSASEGLNILINIFAGVKVNAAAGIANQVSSQLYSFITNFQTAFGPQIVKSYAANDIPRFNSLIFMTSKFSYFLMLFISLPLFFTMQTVLDIWLKSVPEYSCIFCQLIICFLIIEALAAPLWMSVQAKGNIRNYQIFMASCIFTNLPISYLVLRLGFPIYSVWIVRVSVNILTFSARLYYMVKYMDFPISLFFKKVLVPIIQVTVLSIPIPLILTNMPSYWMRFYLLIVISLAQTLLLIYFLGMNNNERKMLLQGIKKRISLIKKINKVSKIL